MSYYVLEAKGATRPENHITGLQRVTLQGHNTQQGVYFFRPDGTTVIGFILHGVTYFIFRSTNDRNALSYRDTVRNHVAVQYVTRECTGKQAQDIFAIATTLTDTTSRRPIG
jgi:hypothetical protein